MSQKIQIRRGVEAQRALVTPDAGEPLFTTDTRELFIGDGATPGGLFVGGGSAVGFVQKYRGTVALASGGSLSIGYNCTTFDPASTTEIGSFSFFGAEVPVYCTRLAPPSGPDPAETRTFSGALTVANEWA